MSQTGSGTVEVYRKVWCKLDCRLSLSTARRDCRIKKNCNPKSEEKMVSANWLKKTELFEGLEESQLNDLLAHSTSETFPGGKIIFY